ncbi:MAG: tyrosine-type recombinase/integrase [Candidatus Nitronauta litoralis]|uniref:Tyrosine-type recombinase/integrase n=1 Tax=Candidatus Nitronauta litoralis TaxID=2705533 RepID=A0A7T0G0W6_9BACT|nr:MAG: tyrosine-type recombinase/integrase [Candidatus Nitronauta litoralis]
MGEIPSRSRKKVKNLEKEYFSWMFKNKSEDVQEWNTGAWKKRLNPFFGELFLKEVTQEKIFEYRDIRESDGSKKSTISKELRTLKEAIQLVDPSFTLPEKIKYKNTGKKADKAPTLEQVQEVGSLMAQHRNHASLFRAVYIVQAGTGLDTSDILTDTQGGKRKGLTRKNIKLAEGVIRKERGKTSKPANIPILPFVREVLQALPFPLETSQFLFEGPIRAYNVSVQRNFKRIGAGGFGSKSLRHFVTSTLFNSGADWEWIQAVLGHEPGSRKTADYVHVDLEIAKKRFKKAFKSCQTIA